MTVTEALSAAAQAPRLMEARQPDQEASAAAVAALRPHAPVPAVGLYVGTIQHQSLCACCWLPPHRRRPPALGRSPPPFLQAAAPQESVCVAVNVRPLIDHEIEEGARPTLFITPGEPQVRQSGGRHAPTSMPGCTACTLHG